MKKTVGSSIRYPSTPSALNKSIGAKRSLTPRKEPSDNGLSNNCAIPFQKFLSEIQSMKLVSNVNFTKLSQEYKGLVKVGMILLK